MADQAAAEKEYAEKLLRMVKKEVKQIMEEAVTRKFVHEESSSITSLCAAVDACLSHGLKRRALGLFKTNSTTALLQKVAKNFEPASFIARRVADIENADPNKRSSSSSDSTCKLKSSQSQGPGAGQPGQQQQTQTGSPASKKLNQVNPRFLWIRLALFEKILAKIVDHLVQNSSKYYEKEALVADPVTGQILASLLVGPCALDYSKMKTQDHFWTDPPADELVQRHRLSSAHPLLTACPSTPPSVRRLGLQYRKDIRMSVGSSEDSVSGGSVTHTRSAPISARDYVDSLHQNSKSTLLYGKNNVLVQPRENLVPMPGYLSLHQTPDSLTIKWTPNQLMNGCSNSPAETSSSSDSTQDKSSYWDYAMCFNVDDIVYLHCHQQADSGGTIVLVGLDGIQHPPIHFPKGGHMLAFLSCLENGLLPHGQLDPPLWSQRGKGKVFPKLRRRGRGSARKPCKEPCEEGANEEEEEASDYVFRIITSLKPDSISQEMLDPKLSQPQPSTLAHWNSKAAMLNNRSLSNNGNGALPATPGTPTGNNSVTFSKPSLKHKFSSSSSTSTSSSKSITEETETNTTPPPGQSIQLLCDTMKRQIISRAFYGWLAHCRHLRTVRTHLSGLVHQNIVTWTTEFEAGLTESIWRRMQSEEGTDKSMQDVGHLYRLTYFGGVEHCIRKEVWPYLLGHYQFGSSNAERQEQDNNNHTSYETTMSEWLAVEAIVRQRDKEIMAANLAKLSSESTNSEIPLVGPKDANLSNEVFEDISTGDSFDHAEDDTAEEDEPGASLELDEKAKDVTVGDQEVARSGENTPSRTPLLRHHPVDSQSIIVTNPSVDLSNGPPTNGDLEETEKEIASREGEKENGDQLPVTGGETLNPGDLSSAGDGASQISSRSSCISPASSSGGVYSMELLDLFSLNIHRIDKDVQRCDRNYWYFTTENLEKLRNVMCTYVWEHLDIGYVQGMCDLVAPLLVVFDDEVLTYSCFCKLMLRMAANFPHGGAMDAHFANMRSLIQILDAEIFELMHQNGDYTHFYFCYRWFLLDFKRELVYDDVFSVWETIWASQHVASNHFVLFIALALVEYYRDIILENNMDFTDIIKFFNEMAERHDAKAVLKVARELVLQIQTLIDNK